MSSEVRASGKNELPNEMTVTGWRRQSNTFSATDLVSSVASAVERGKSLNAYITTTPERAMDQARHSTERQKSGAGRALEGVVIGVKDNFCTADIQTTAGSRILEGFIPQYESFVTKKLLDAGAVFFGKTNLDEFGMGSSTENSAYGPTLNPCGIALGSSEFVPGGSSGGSAAAVAADQALAAMATDTGGSIRQPASFCGVVGFKPTYGACSRWGIVAYASSLDQAGVITKTVGDAALLMDVIAGSDPKDSTSVAYDFGGFEHSLRNTSGAFTVGIPRQFRDMSTTPDLEGVWQEIERRVSAAGGCVQLVDLPTIKYSLPTYYIIALAEASSNLARYDGVRFGYRANDPKNLIDLYERSRAEGFGRETKRRIMLGTYCLSAGYYDQYYAKAQRVRTMIYNDFARAFEAVDFLAWPTTPTPAFKFGSHNADPVSMYLEDVFTVPVNLAGLPAISLPIFQAANGMPMGGQLIGPRFSDARLLAVANSMLK